MTGESGGSEERRWLVEPPGPQQINFQIAAGDQAEVTSELRQAFDDFLDALAGAEVEGYARACTDYIKGCTTNSFACSPRGKCTQESQAPCLMDYYCAISRIS
jgi:hypothetical protein